MARAHSEGRLVHMLARAPYAQAMLGEPKLCEGSPNESIKCDDNELI